MKRNTIRQTESIFTEPKKKLSIADYTLLTVIVLFLGMDFLSAFGSIDILATQYLYVAVLNLFIAIYWFFNPEILQSELILKFKKPLYLKCYLIFVVMGGLSVFAAGNVSVWISNFAQIVIIMATTFNFILLFQNKKHLIFHIAFLVTVALLIKSCNELYTFFKSIKTIGITNAISLMKGNTGNINIFSATLNMKTAFLILSILYFKNWKKWLSLLGLFLSMLIIFFLDSRATILAIVIEMLFLSIFLFWNKETILQKIKYFGMVILPIIFAFVFSSAITKVNTPKNQIAPTTIAPTTTIYGIEVVEGGSNYSRLKYWTNGVKLAAANPILGIGLGNYCIASLPYEKEDFNNLLVSQHTHNDFLQVTAESGIIGGLSFLLLFISLLILNIKKLKDDNDTETKLIAFSTILLVIAYSVDSFFNFPMHRPTIQLFFCLMIVMSFINETHSDHKINFEWSKKLAFTGIVLSAICVFCAFITFTAFRLENDIAADNMNTNKVLNSTLIKERVPLFPNTFSNSEPFFEQIGIYLVSEKKYSEAHKYLNKARQINPYNGRIEWYKHRIARENNKKDSAYIYAKSAFEIRPRNNEFYLTVLGLAIDNKDTVGILNSHKKIAGYIKTAQNYVHAANALSLAGYNKKNVLTFVENGLKKFPTDSLLLERKKVFEYDAIANKPGVVFDVSKGKNMSPTEKHINYLKLAMNYGGLNQFDKSLECYREAIKFDPTNLTIIQNIGICLFKLNRFKEAIQYLEKVLQAPTLQDGKTEYLLGLCFFNIQNKQKACYFVKIAIAKNFPGALASQSQFCK